jgi:hypothetical protein
MIIALHAAHLEPRLRPPSALHTDTRNAAPAWHLAKRSHMDWIADYAVSALEHHREYLNLKREFHQPATKLRIFGFEPFKQSLIARTPTIKLPCFRIPHRLPSTLTCTLQAQHIAHETTPYFPTISQLSVEWYRCARQGEVTHDAHRSFVARERRPHRRSHIQYLRAVQGRPSMLICGAANCCDSLTLFC